MNSFKINLEELNVLFFLKMKDFLEIEKIILMNSGKVSKISMKVLHINIFFKLRIETSIDLIIIRKTSFSFPIIRNPEINMFLLLIYL